MRKRTYCKHLEACMDGVYCKEGHGGSFGHCIYFLEEHKCPYYESKIEELEKTINEEYADITDYKELVIKETAREILKEFEYCNNKTFFTKWYDLCKQFGVDLGE